MMLLQWQSIGSAEPRSLQNSFQWCNFPPKQRGKGNAMITTEDIEDALDGLFYLNQLLPQNPMYSILPPDMIPLCSLRHFEHRDRELAVRRQPLQQVLL